MNTHAPPAQFVLNQLPGPKSTDSDIASPMISSFIPGQSMYRRMDSFAASVQLDVSTDPNVWPPSRILFGVNGVEMPPGVLPVGVNPGVNSRHNVHLYSKTP